MSENTRYVKCTFCGWSHNYDENIEGSQEEAWNIANNHAGECEQDPRNQTIAALRERVAALEAERNEISKAIRVTLDDGTAPDNLVEHVQFLMIEEYDPMAKRIDALKRQLQESK